MNTFIKTFSYLFLATCLSVFIPHNTYASMPAQMPQQGPGIPGLPQLSEAEMKQFEAELAELNSKLEGKSPEEQEAILNEMVQEAMEEVRKDLSDEGKAILDKLEQGDITEEDFDKLLNELMPTEEKEAPAPVETKATPKAVEPKIIITSKHQEVLDRINSLINHTNLFIQKAGTIAELPGKINQWEKEKKISWQPKLTWNTFRSDLDMFVSMLNKLKEQDPKTQQYKHLDELLKNEALYNNISKVEKIAAEFEPKIEEIAPIGGLPIPESSKAALQKLLSQYNEALYILKLSSAISALFEKFEPKAKSSREAEEKAQKIAEQEQKKPRTPGRSVVGGSSARESYYPPYEDTYNEYDQFGYNSNQPNQVFIPTYEPQDTFLPSSRSSRGGSSKTSSSFSSPSASKEGSFKGNSSEAATVNPDTPEKDKTPAIPHHVVKKMEKEKSTLESVTNPLKDIASLVKDNKVLSELEAEVKKSGAYNKKLVEQILPDLDSALRKAKREFESFNATAKSADQKKHFSAQIKDKGKKAVEALNTLITQIDALEKIKNTLPLENQYVYFGNSNINEYMAEIIEKTLPLAADHNRFIKIWEDAGFANIAAVTQQYIIEKNPSAAVQQTLNDMSKIVENLNKIEQELPHPIILSNINKFAKDVRQAIG